MLKAYKGDKDKLGKTEQFFMEIMEIPRLGNRLECFVYKREFVNKVMEITEVKTLQLVVMLIKL
jgi:hypothetical protein